jgi:hypothetical protein
MSAMPVDEKFLHEYAGLEVPAEQQERAVRAVAAAASDAADCRMLLDMLGLDVTRAQARAS